MILRSDYTNRILLV